MQHHGITKRLLNLLFPQQCLLCGTPHQTRAGVCEHCNNDLPRNSSACYCCAQPLPPASHDETIILCGQCLQSKPPFQGSFSPYIYTFPLAQLIGRYKYQRNFAIGKVLENLLWQAVSTMPPAWLTTNDQVIDPDTTPILVPVPLHWKRQLYRGFNQADRLAHSLGKQLQLPVVHVCKRTHGSTPQHELKRTQRLKNLRHKFTVTQPVYQKHLVLIDDVMTTGATLYELSRILLLAGARRVDTITLARTP